MNYNVDGVGGHVFGRDFLDADGNPSGGDANGMGYHIMWHNDPVNREASEQPTGAFVEDVIQSCMMRLRFYQGEPYVDGGYENASDGRFACAENADALAALESAHESLMARRKDRGSRDVLGKYEK